MPAILSILFLGISVFLFFFFQNATSANNQKAELTGIEWQAETSKRDEITTLDHSILVIGDERTALETHFAQSSDVVPFLDTMEGLAVQAGAKAQVTSATVSASATPILSIGMKATGSFSSLYQFLSLLENSPYALEFTSMDIQKETASGTVWDLNVNMNLLSFVN